MSEGEIFILLMYAAIGITATFSIIVFVWGFAIYISRLGTVRREDGIWIMEDGIRLIITTIVLIGILNLITHWFQLA